MQRYERNSKESESGYSSNTPKKGGYSCIGGSNSEAVAAGSGASAKAPPADQSQLGGSDPQKAKVRSRELWNAHNAEIDQMSWPQIYGILSSR